MVNYGRGGKLRESSITNKTLNKLKFENRKKKISQLMKWYTYGGAKRRRLYCNHMDSTDC